MLPNAGSVLIPREKITGYLLSAGHPVGRTKAAFFTRFGFTQALWTELSEALRAHAAVQPVVTSEQTPFGVRYTVE